MTSMIKIPPAGKINPMTTKGFRHVTDENGNEWIGIHPIIKYLIMEGRPTFNPEYVRKKWIAEIIGEEHLRFMPCMASSSQKIWFISKMGLALLVSKRDDPRAYSFFDFSGRQGLGRLSDWAEGVLKEELK